MSLQNDDPMVQATLLMTKKELRKVYLRHWWLVFSFLTTTTKNTFIKNRMNQMLQFLLTQVNEILILILWVVSMMSIKLFLKMKKKISILKDNVIEKIPFKLGAKVIKYQ